ncbi:MAG TPA: hypothetical protein VIM84_03610 [Gemmatimonadales bacterium]
MSAQNAAHLLTSLGKDDGEEEGVTRRRKPKNPEPESAAPSETTEAQRRAEERRVLIEDQPALQEVSRLTVRRAPEPKCKVSVDLPWTVKQALDDLCARDRRGPKLEITDALTAHLTARGITIQNWNADV